jgi:hypothetical protein
MYREVMERRPVIVPAFKKPNMNPNKDITDKLDEIIMLIQKLFLRL